jgi:hypothetical protein
MARMLQKRTMWLAASCGGLAFLAGCNVTNLDPDILFNAALQIANSTLVFLLQNVVAG